MSAAVAHRVRVLLCCGGALLAVAACGGGSAQPTSHASASPPAAALAPGEDPMPSQDTPVAQAPAALAAAWTAYGATLIPGHASLQVDGVPAAQDRSGGRLDAAQVQAVGDAVMRTQVLAAWADEHDQPAVLAHVVAEPFLLGPVGVAVAEGTRVHTPRCGMVPTSFGVHAPDATMARELGAAANAPVDGGVVLVDMAFAGPCDITGTTRDGRDVEVTRLDTVHLLVAAELRDDPLLGTVAYMEAGALCSDPRFSAACG